jgi:hypothetical protein
VGVQHHAPGCFTPGKEPVPNVQEAGRASGLIWMGKEILPPLGFNPETVQPIATYYTDDTILVTPSVYNCNEFFYFEV